MTLLPRSIASTLPRFAKQTILKSTSGNVANAVRRWNSSQPGADIGPHLSPVWDHLTMVQPVRGEGIYLWDADGTKYTDFTSGIGVTNLGHTHPKITEAIRDQATRLHFGQMNVVMLPQFIELSEKLNEVTPDGIDSFFFANSGAEATEAAVKLARHASGKKNIVVFKGSFHGRTAQCMAMTTSKYIYRENYAPLPGGIHVAPFPNSYFYGWERDVTIDFCMKELERVIMGQTSPDETAAIFVEPVLGEGGYVPVPNEFMTKLRDFCNEHDILLVVDEIQSGFGRTGKLFAIEHSGVRPDILIMAKGLGNGMPVSAVGAPHELMTRWKKGTHGGTYGGGNAMVARAALATIDVMQEEKIPENAAKTGEYLMDKLRGVQERNPVIGDVRGLGLMVGTEFTDPFTGKPAGDVAMAVRSACIEKNFLVLSCGTYGNVIRWIPPLIVTEAQIDDAVDIFEQAIKDVTGYMSSEEEKIT
mmetsp:Transcript_5327/g.15474  ORF Transcript_5327/g.15474 Transcript_5327/m.15474 type:complete len:474 (-) Transcript_5327:1592-3013(-)|eukprot:CAMPEP_0172361498 /NCGR_PEP_ID=MMETSP1060-20121228/5301_1 /TAXON_ID=37318 /ORGANISM="Pseudo-nitzschia pungens, Strain cf. cingulata" /LENGTH=473 /DNA_ID=CAMNT_0013083757 /DNA_START=198 /DNA_END=1619 /DNA_ORIENTATION=-